MAKVILEFDQNEEALEINNAINGWKWKAAFLDLSHWLRSEVKYNSDNTQEEVNAYEHTRERIHEILQSWNLNLDE